MIRDSFVLWSGASLLLLAATVPTARADGDKAERVPVYCPAIGAEDRPRTNMLAEQTRQPTLVVLGTARRAGNPDGRARALVEIDVEKVLYGSAPGKTIRCAPGWSYWAPEKPQQLIFALAPTLDPKDRPFEVRYTFPPEEEKVVAALSAARMAYNVLSAEIIFVGKEVTASAEKGRIVEVLRVLHGPESLKGKRVCVDLLEHPIARGFTVPQEPAPTKGEHLYFVASVDSEYKKRGFRSIEKPDGPVHLVYYFLPGDQEKTVSEVLKQRDRHPLMELDNSGEKVICREILFQGNIEEAVAMLGSESKGAVLLAGRFLIHRKKEARAPVLDAIRADLLLTERKGGFDRLHTLITMIPQLDTGTKKDDVHELIETWLAHVSKNPPEPPATRRLSGGTYYRPEQQYFDVNHGLAWLIEQLDEKTVLDRYGTRLLKLRDAAPAGWKRELQLALDVAKVEDNLELADAFARLKDVRPVRSRAGLRHPGSRGEGVVAFSPDGKHMATVGGGDLRVWRTDDWTLAAPAIPLKGSIERITFSPEGKFLYVAGGGGGLQIHARYDWKAGRVDRAYSGHRSGVADMLLSADGRTMATSNYYEDTIHVWDTETGRIRRTFAIPYLGSQIALSADGATLLRRVALEPDTRDDAKTAWVVEALGPGALKVPKAVLDDNPALVAFSPDGTYFLTVGRPKQDVWGGNSVERTVRLYDVRDGFREIGKTTVASLPPKRVTFDVERRIVLIVGRWTAHDAHALTLPELKPVKGFEKVQRACRDPKSACFSPDGKLVVLASSGPAPRLFRTDTYEEVIPYDGHTEDITQVFFPPGGKFVRTLGRDNTLCTWDARTLKLVKRQSLPADWNQESGREPDGRYLIGSTLADQEHVLQTFDVESEKVIATVTVPRERFGALRLFWTNEREMYAFSAGELCHFDAISGKVITRRECKDGPGRWSGLTGGGKDVIHIGGWFPKSSRVEVKRVSVGTGKVAPVGEFNLARFSGNKAGVVPGGKFIFVGDPGLYLFDARTLKPAAALPLSELLSLDFTADGSRFAVVTGERIYIDRNLRQWDPQTRSVVRIHDVATGRTLGAFPASTRWVSVKFAPDGKQLAVINDDGTVELWYLSVLNNP
jgi:WD40 repeat protein